MPETDLPPETELNLEKVIPQPDRPLLASQEIRHIESVLKQLFLTTNPDQTLEDIAHKIARVPINIQIDGNSLRIFETIPRRQILQQNLDNKIELSKLQIDTIVWSLYELNRPRVYVPLVTDELEKVGLRIKLHPESYSFTLIPSEE